MKRTLVFLLAAVMLCAGAFGSTADDAGPKEKSSAESYNQGTADAQQQHSALAWALLGAPAGFVFGVFGTGGATIIALLSNPRPPYIPDGVDARSYVDGYAAAGKRKNTGAAAVSALIGWGIWAAIIFSVLLL